jgi:hypothetical protein
MVLLLPENPSFGTQIARGLGGGFSKGLSKASDFGAQIAMQKSKSKQDLLNELSVQQYKDAQRRKMLADIEGIPFEDDQSEMTQTLEQAVPAIEEKLGFKLMPEQVKAIGQQLQMGQSSRVSSEEGVSPRASREVPKDPYLKAKKYAAIGEKPLADIAAKEAERGFKEFESERGYHTGFSKTAEENVAKLRESIPRKEMALSLARNAIEAGDLSFFSKDKLADITGIDAFRTAKGAQLITASKENLLSNMSRTSARAQNLWFEQRLNSMFPKIGQSDEANLTIQEMLDGELAMDKLYQTEFDRMARKDEEQLGYVRKDIDRRVREEVKPLEKQIFSRTMFRLRELEEQEQGLEKIQKQVGKNVLKGTPLTLAMAKLYKNKFGKDAQAVARKNGYHIPTLEEYKLYREQPVEFSEELSQ